MAKTGLRHTSAKYIKLADRELITLAKNGEQLAFTILFERYHHGLMSHIQSILLGGRNAQGKEQKYDIRELSEEPEDICQETFNKAFLKINTYNADYEFSTWLYSIAYRTTLDFIRKTKTMREKATSVDSERENLVYNLSGNKVTPEEVLIGSQETMRVMDAIEKLPQIYKEVMLLYGVQEYANEEIAQKLGITVSAVKVRVNRAKNMLADILKDNPIAQKRKKKGGQKRQKKSREEQNQ